MLHVARLNERLKEEARFRLHGDGFHDAGASVSDDSVTSNLRQQLSLAIRVSCIAVLLLSFCSAYLACLPNGAVRFGCVFFFIL